MKRTLLLSTLIGFFPFSQAQLASINENFDSFTVITPGFPQNGWTMKAPNNLMVLINEDGTNKFVQGYASTQTNVPHYLISPQIVAPDGTKTLSFEAAKFTQSGFMGTIEAGLVSNPNDMATFTSLGPAVTLQTTTPQMFTYLVSASLSQYIAFKFVGLDAHASTKLDNISYGTSGNLCSNTDPGNTVGNTGCVTFNFRGQSTTYTTVRGADGKIWLQQNLGSTKTAASLTDSDAYGDLFQWGRWDDGHQLRNSNLMASAPLPNNPAGLSGGNASFYSAGYNSSSNFWSGGIPSDSWNAVNSSSANTTNGADPCKAIGLNWRLPTIDEIDAVMTAENITEYNSALASNLKLIPAGIKDYNGIFSPGTRLYLWSSSSSPYTGSGQHWYISQYSSLSNDAGRDSGMSVRCIKDITTGLGTSDIKKTTIGIYPNPTEGILYIKTHYEIEGISIMNLAGQFMNAKFSHNQVDLQGLSKGIYIIELKLKNGQKISKKIIKE